MQQRLQDVMIMRPLAIVLMIVWHSFIVYVGGWREPAGYIVDYLLQNDPSRLCRSLLVALDRIYCGSVGVIYVD